MSRYFALLYVALCVMIGLFWPQVEIEGAAWGDGPAQHPGAYLLLAGSAAGAAGPAGHAVCLT